MFGNQILYFFEKKKFSILYIHDDNVSSKRMCSDYIFIKFIRMAKSNRICWIPYDTIQIQIYSDIIQRIRLMIRSKSHLIRSLKK
jgi:hypothetical protein